MAEEKGVLMGLPFRRIGEARQLSEHLQGRTLRECSAIYSELRQKAGKWRPSTAENFRLVTRDWWELGFGSLHPNDLATEHAEALLIHVSSRYSAQWANTCIRMLRTFCQWLVKHGRMVRDVTAILEPIEETEMRRVYHDWTREEVARLCEFLSQPMRRFVLCALWTGLRLATLLALTWSMWRTLPRGVVLVIPATLLKQRSALVRRGQREFIFPVHPELRKVLEPTRGPPEPILWGLPSRRTIRMELKSAARKAGFDPRWAFPHNMRRSCCALLHAGGVKREDAQLLMGWSSSAVMLDAYWPLQDADEKLQIIQKLT
jgi:integrase